ncbi:MAG: peptidylprolyl isomerase, partial [Myxococcota bacterium]|nr:peptidylprolyl isomerase [Myxococcota bacterium]
EEEIARYYDENAYRYEQEEQVSARHILFKLDSEASPDEIEAARKRAEEVMLLAKQPDADFGELAKQYSEGPSAPKGGDLGYFPAKRMVEPFSKAAFALQIGEVSEPVKTQFGWHLIKVEGKKPARTVPFEEVKDQIREQLEAKQLRNAYGTLLDEVKAKAEVTMLFENIRYRGDVSSETPEP